MLWRGLLPRATIHRAEKHVAAVQRYPELAQFGQQQALALAASLGGMPEGARPGRGPAAAATRWSAADGRRSSGAASDVEHAAHGRGP